MLPKPFAVWLPALFTAILAVIVTVANLWVYARGGPQNSAVMIFMLFLPMAFIYSASYQQATNIYVKTLEERIKILEANPETSR